MHLHIRGLFHKNTFRAEAIGIVHAQFFRDMCIEARFSIDAKTFIVVATRLEDMFEFAIFFITLPGGLIKKFTYRYLHMVNICKS